MMKNKWLYSSFVAVTAAATLVGVNLEAATAVTLSSNSLSSLAANSTQPFYLPNLTGAFSVGTVSYQFTDFNRTEIFDPSGAAGNRQLAVQVWYPGQALPGASSKAYLEEAGIPIVSGLLGIEPDILSSIRPHALSAVPVATDQSRYPVVFLSPGGNGSFLEQHTAQAEELSSHGYVVVGISHTYESLVTVFPDGQAIQANLSLLPKFTLPENPTEEDLQKMLETRKQLVEVRTADARFVLDQLEQINVNDPKGLLAGFLDLDNVGIYGHSLGGVTVPEILRSDSRFKAGLSLDSDPLSIPFLDYFEGVIPEGLDQPYMIVSDRNDSPNYTNVDEFFASLGLRNDGYSVAIGGMEHGNFSDLPLLSPLLLANGFPPEELELGSIDPLLGTQVANAYNRAFFDRYFKNIDSPLLQGGLPDGMNQEDITFVKVSPATSVPEPATTVTLFGFAGLGLLTSKRKKTC